MLSKLDKAEKNPNEGWKCRMSLVSYSSDEGDEISKSDSQEDEVLLLDTGDDAKKHLKSKDDKNPLHYIKSSSYKIPKKSIQKCTTSSNGTTTSSQSSQISSSDNIKRLGFDSTFSPTKNAFKCHPSTKTHNNVRYRINRQWNSPFIKKKVYNMSSTPKPNLSTSRCRKQEQPFNADINMMSGAKSSNERKSNQQTEDEKQNLHPSNTCTSSGKLKGNDYFIKSNEKDILSAVSLCESEEETKDKTEVSKETLKSTSYEKCQSNSMYLSSDSKEEDSESDTSRRHTYPSSSTNSCSDNNEDTRTGCNNSVEVSRRHSFPSSSATPRPSIHKNINENNSESKDSSLNKKSYYGNLLSNFYPFNKETLSENKTLPSQNDNDKKRKLTCGDDESGGNVKEPSQKKKYQKKYSKTRQKVAPPSPAKVEIISSDEEEQEPTKKPEDHSSPSTASKSSEDTNPNLENNIAKSKSKVVNGASFDRDGFRAEIILGPKILLGSLQVAAKGTLEISFDQLRWKMEHKDKTVTILVQPNEFTALKIHVDADPKIIVLEVAQCLALKLRHKFLGNGKFIDPGSPVIGEKDIILEIEDNLSQESIADLSEWVKDTHGKEFEELSLEEAQKLLVQHTSQPGTKPRTYNTRSTNSKTTNSNVTPTKMIIYPPPPKHGSITVTTADLECLAQGEFLNDVIIDFYLKYIYHDILTEKDRERTHIFSSYFYKRLTQKSTNDTGGGLLSSEDRMHKMHDRVKKWTRNVDLFDKDFIVVPINESSHWFLAIICFPHLDGPIEEEEILSESNDADEVEVEDTDESDFMSTSTSKKNSANLPVLKANPCILIFDSLGGSGRARVTLNLRGYLTCEWKNKRSDKPEKEFSKESIKGTFPKVPHQDNHCDCGVFVLEYVESFFKDPIKNYRAPIDKSNWFTQQKVYSKRQEIKNLIYDLKNRASDEEPSCTEDKSDE